MHSKTSEIQYISRRQNLEKLSRETVMQVFKRNIDFFDIESDEFVLTLHMLLELNLKKEEIASERDVNSNLVDTVEIYKFARRFVGK